MEPIRLANEIRNKIHELKAGRNELKNRAKNKAETLAIYEREISKVIIKLRNEIEFELDGNTIKNPPVSIIDKLAKGICWKEKLAAEQAEAEYRNAIKGMDSLMAELNGLQSINRYLDSTE